MNAEVEFASVGCNRVVNALDWGEEEFIAYGAHHAVAIYSVMVRCFLYESACMTCIVYSVCCVVLSF